MSRPPVAYVTPAQRSLAPPQALVAQRPPQATPVSSRALWFTVLAFALTWPFWWGAALAERGAFAVPFPSDLLLVLGGIGPSLAGILLARRAVGGAGVRQLLDRARRWRVAPGWYAAVVLGPFALQAGAITLHVVLGGQAPAFGQMLRLLPGILASVIPIALVFGPLGEEFGWRGTLLPLLQGRFSALGASLLLGGLWALWHLPMFFNPTLSYAAVPAPVYLASMLGSAVLFSWVYNGTGGSLLLPLLLHSLINASGAVWEAVPDAGSDAHQWLLITIAVWVAAAIVIAVSGARDLARRPRQTWSDQPLSPATDHLGRLGYEA
jgi:membrane protease YdiL (CAAX protease family)